MRRTPAPVYYYPPRPGTYTERCGTCLGSGCKFRYPETGGIDAYPCPTCAGRGEVHFLHKG